MERGKLTALALEAIDFKKSNKMYNMEGGEVNPFPDPRSKCSVSAATLFRRVCDLPFDFDLKRGSLPRGFGISRRFAEIPAQAVAALVRVGDATGKDEEARCVADDDNGHSFVLLLRDEQMFSAFSPSTKIKLCSASYGEVVSCLLSETDLPNNLFSEGERGCKQTKGRTCIIWWTGGLHLLLSTIRGEQRALERLIGGLQSDSLLQDSLKTVIDICSERVRAGGRLFFVGVGKSAVVADKIARTSSSLNVPASFMPAIDIIHGDAGGIRSNDIVFIISNSGTTIEALRSATCVRMFGCHTVSVSSVPRTPLSLACHSSIWYFKHDESDHLGVAPTASVIATISLLDGVVNSVSASCNISLSDFAKAHPGGSLGAVFWGPSFLRYVDNGQAHVFDALKNGPCPDLLDQLKSFNVEEQLSALKFALDNLKRSHFDDFIPFPEVCSKLNMQDVEKVHVTRLGRNLIADGRVGILVLAGGNASRMGIDYPKALLDIGLPSKRCLLAIQLEQIASECALAGLSRPRLPICLLLNEENKTAVVEFLRAKSWFGFHESDFIFVTQPNMLCFDENGGIIMSSTSKMLTAPNGHGGMYEALHNSGALSQLEKRGVQYLLTSCVDNPLTIALDPLYVGYCDLAGCDMGFKIVSRRGPDEPAGVVCHRKGRAHYIEYSEMPPEFARATNKNGSLRFREANTLNLLLRIDLLFLLGQNPQLLPYHVARKHVTSIHGPIRGIKLERFAPDGCTFAGKVAVLEVAREEEFSPIKNGFGSLSDSPGTALEAIHALGLKRLNSLGLTTEARRVEISYGVEDILLEKTFKDSTFGRGRDIFLSPNSIAVRPDE